MSESLAPGDASPPAVAGSAAQAVPTACDNCATPLRGDFCHACGQSTHSPVRHVGHAVEEVFESFWHLDGRIFRTLRDLFVPGLIAVRYLAGHRVRYVAPMRLFVILTLLTFFVAKFVVQDALTGLDPRAMVQASDMRADLAAAESVTEVEAIGEAALADLDEARRVTGAIPGVAPQLAEAEAQIRDQVRRRIEALDPDAAAASAAASTVASSSDAEAADRARAPETFGSAVSERIDRNFLRLRDDPGAYVRALLGVAPTALFILVPLFAVLLKLLYLFQGRLYLEHVVVGLYSHAALMLGLLLVFACTLGAHALVARAPWAADGLEWLRALLLWALPVYLLLMQKRVYGQGWGWTLFKFAVISQLYFALFLSVAMPMAGYALYTL
ncbi:DUF3667 domain-containing protein [Luteimonas deserti]|uniref:DUF3667 domain-containing protein n=1 Tax=Luteimonas deserti TaxID=2752306 RepID=A0A7Z0QR82_9GAMM|nr:DUF3667 domain-containing protein [Luteimonas deserti]NYZ62295.1 DUF3667 domain-containing protein [Luteimonas deserti]